MKLPSFLMSSADPAKLGLTVRGALLAILPIVIIFSGLTEAELLPAVDAIVSFVTITSSAVAAFWFALGLVRKIYFRIKDGRI